MKKAVSTLATLMLLASAAFADLILYEGFDYPLGTGNLTGQTGGSGWSTAWGTRASDAIIAGLNNPLSATPGGGIGGANYVAQNSNGRSLNGTPYAVEGQVIWFSLIVSTPAAALNSSNDRLLLFTSNSSGAQGTSSTWGFGFQLSGTGSAPTFQAKIASVNGTFTAAGTGANDLLVGRYVHSLSGPKTLSLWLNPTSTQINTYMASGNLADMGTAATATYTGAQVTFGTGSTVYPRANNIPTWVMDELRVGTTIGDVLAEPPKPSLKLIGIYSE
jgi:hypothetical protein